MTNFEAPWVADKHHYSLPTIPPASDMESRAVLKSCINARADLVNKGVAKRQAASRYLQDMVELGVLVEQTLGKEKLFIHPKLMKLLSHDGNQFETYFAAH